ncbi:MAG: hypothetical protein H7227_00770 [Actinobacteria bacterium]|nr:hypothetical protein [Actinomycetota bacterium]
MKKLIALVAVASTLLLSACSQVGVAATVGSTKITQTQVQKSIDEALKERTKVDTSGMSLETGAAFNRNQVRFHVIAELLNAIAVDQKLTVTKAEIDARRAEIVQQIGGEEKLASALVGASIALGDFLEYIELILNSEKIGAAIQASGVSADATSAEIQKLIVAKAAAVKVTVNPRYGKWDAVAGDIIPTDAASPAATPAATTATE